MGPHPHLPHPTRTLVLASGTKGTYENRKAVTRAFSPEQTSFYWYQEPALRARVSWAPRPSKKQCSGFRTLPLRSICGRKVEERRSWQIKQEKWKMESPVVSPQGHLLTSYSSFLFLAYHCHWPRLLTLDVNWRRPEEPLEGQEKQWVGGGVDIHPLTWMSQVGDGLPGKAIRPSLFSEPFRAILESELKEKTSNTDTAIYNFDIFCC